MEWIQRNIGNRELKLESYTQDLKMGGEINTEPPITHAQKNKKNVVREWEKKKDTVWKHNTCNYQLKLLMQLYKDKETGWEQRGPGW